MKSLHVGLRASDVESSIAFYNALGFEVLGEVTATEFGNLTMLKLPGDEFVSLELVDSPRRDQEEPSGLHHFVIGVEAVHAIVARLAGLGFEAEAPSSPDGSTSFWTAWLTDPDGHRIELVQWPPGHPQGMTAADLSDSVASGEPGHKPNQGPEARSVSERTAKDVVEEMFRRQQAGDPTVLDDLVAQDLVNHAAGPQGREGLKRILRTIDDDLGPLSAEQHHLIGDGDLVAQHLTVHGTHRASTMPLLASVSPSGRAAEWTFIHLWRVTDGMIVEHWACRDDMGLLEQLSE